MHTHIPLTPVITTIQHQEMCIMRVCRKKSNTKESTTPQCIAEWNIGGLHRKIGDGGIKRYLEHFSSACLVETFVGNLYDLTKHFTGHVSPAMKLLHQGRRAGSVLLLVKRCFSKLIERIDTPYDQMIVVKRSKTLSAQRYSNLCFCASTRKSVL